MGSAIVDDQEMHGHEANNEADLSSATLRNDEGHTVMQDIVPFAFVAQTL